MESIFWRTVKQHVRIFFAAHSGEAFLHTTENPLAVRKSAEVFVRQARAYDERQMGTLLAPLWGAANKGITIRFQYTAGIQGALVVDRKNARVCIVDKLPGFSMPIFKVVIEQSAHVFKIHENAELFGVSNADLEELLATARAPTGMSSCSRARAVVAALISLFLWAGKVCRLGPGGRRCEGKTPRAHAGWQKSLFHHERAHRQHLRQSSRLLYQLDTDDP